VGSFLSEHGVDINPACFMRDLSPSTKLYLNILKSVFLKPKIIILDEVFERLVPGLHHPICTLLQHAKSQGASIIVLTHRIDEIYGFSEKITILKDGKALLTEEAANIDKMSLVHLTYTQMSQEDTAALHNEEFTALLKYNEAITNSLPFSLIIVDENLRVKFINENARHFLCISKADYYNTDFASILVKRNRQLAVLVAENLHRNEECRIYNIPVYSSKDKKQINLAIYPMRDGWNTIGFFVIIEDVTEEEQMRSRIALSDKLSSIGLLAAGVAHEINNPLAIMLNYVQSIRLISHDKRLAPKIGLLEEQIAYIKTIVSDLITLSDGRVSQEDVEVNELILNMINFIRFYSKNQNVQIVFQHSKQEIWVKANKNEMKQVLLNLFKNSFEAMPMGGKISIETTRFDKQAVPHARIRFRDTGIGVKHDGIRDIFSPFYSTKGAKGAHLGLGLSISYAIISKYGGEITVDTAVKPGCQFNILLPCICESQPQTTDG
jgi:two-component system NtrC family sensor kinase